MNHSSFIRRLKDSLPATQFPWVLAALRQDMYVWESLLEPEFATIVFTEEASRLSTWSPGSLALQALDAQVNAAQLISDIQQPLEVGLRRRAFQTYEGLTASDDEGHPEQPEGCNDGLCGLRAAGLIALALRERRRLVGSWEGLGKELTVPLQSNRGQEFQEPRSFTTWKTPIACLIGLVPDPLDLVHALQAGDATSDHIAIIIHAILSNPNPPEVQFEIISGIVNGLNIQNKKRFLYQVYQQRPALAYELTLKLLELERFDHQIEQPENDQNPLNDAYRMVYASEANHITRQYDQSQKYLIIAEEMVSQFQAELTARMGISMAIRGNPAEAVKAWNRAVELQPNNPIYRANLALAMYDAGKVSEIREWLNNESQLASKGAQTTHPALLFALAYIAYQVGELDLSREAAGNLLASLKAGNEDILGGIITKGDSLPALAYLHIPEKLTELLLELGQPDHASWLARATLTIQPNDPDIALLLGESLAAIRDYEGAVQVLEESIYIHPDRLDMRTKFADYLEAANEWEAALPERLMILEVLRNQPEDPLARYRRSFSVEETSSLHALANCALHAEMPQQALQACQEALGIDAEDGMAHVFMGKALSLLMDHQAAQEHFTKATELAPHLPEPWLALAQSQKMAGFPQQGLDTLRLAAQALPNSPEVYLGLGEAYLEDWQEQGHPALTQALTSLQHATSLSPYDPQVNFRLGQTLYQLGHLQEARQNLKKAYQTTPMDYDIALTYSKCLLDIHEQREALPALSVVYQRALLSGDKSPTAYLNYARTLLEVGDQPDEALNALRHILEASPDHMEARGLLPEALVANGDLPGAMKAYQAAIETNLISDPGWGVRLSLGLGKISTELGQPEIAIAILQEASHIDPQNPLVFRLLAEAYMTAGLLDSALDTARVAIRVANVDADTLIWFADRVIQWCEQAPRGDIVPDGSSQSSTAPDGQLYTEAANALTRAVQLEPQESNLIFKLGEAQLRAKDPQGALITFQRIINNDTATSEELHQVALYLLMLGDAQGAVLCLERALHICPEENNPHKTQDEKILIARSLIDAYRLAGNQQAALASLERALSLCPADPSLYQTKADLLLELGRPLDALTFLEDTIAGQQGESDIAGLLFHTALLQRSTGNLPSALAHCETILNSAKSLSRDTHILAARVLAAEITRALLLPDQASNFLEAFPTFRYESQLELDNEADLGIQSLYCSFSYECLEAELALDKGELDEASSALENAKKFASQISTMDSSQESDRMCILPPLVEIQVRLQAIQSHLDALRGNYDTAVQVLNDALVAINQEANSINTNISSKTPEKVRQILGSGVAHLYPLAETALILGQWEAALYVSRQLVEKAQREPLPHLILAKSLVLRAEAQDLYQSLDVMNHCPGPVAITRHSQKAFEQAIDTAQGQINQWMAPLNKDQASPEHGGSVKSVISHPQASIQSQAEITRWRARGQAIFQPGSQSLQALSAILALIQPSPEDIAAQIAVMRHVLEHLGENGMGDGMANDSSSGEQSGTSGLLNLAMQTAQTFPKHPSVLLQLSLTLSQDEDYVLDSLQATVGGVGECNYSRPPALIKYLLARTAKSIGNFDLAFPAIQSALYWWPDEPQWQHLAGEIAISVGDTHTAILYFEEAVRLEPSQPEHYYQLGKAYLDHSASDRQLLVSAIHALEKAAELDSDQVDIILALARGYCNAGDFERATQQAERAIELAPGTIRPLLLRTEIALQAGDAQKAHEYILAALQVKESGLEAATVASEQITLIILLARTLASLNRSDEALSAIDMALSQANNQLPLLLERAQIMAYAHGPEPAMRTLQELTLEYPKEASVYYHLAEYQAEAGQYEPAIRSAQYALQLASLPVEETETHFSLSEDELTHIHMLLGHLLRNMGQLDQAIHHLSEAIQLTPSLMEAYLELGSTYQDRRDLDRALQAYDQAMKLGAEDPRPYYLAALALKECKDYQNAETLLRRAAALAPTDLAIRRQLGAVIALNLVHNRRRATVEV